MSATDHVTVTHPTDRPNYTVVTIGDLILEFSYRTLISAAGAPVHEATGRNRVTIENYWNQTTGRHLNMADGGDKAGRLTADEFDSAVASVLAHAGLRSIFAGS